MRSEGHGICCFQEERKKRRFLRKASTVRRRYTLAGQSHVLSGLKEGSLGEREALLSQLMGFDLRVLERALQETSSGET